MKKIFRIAMIIAAAAMTFTACNKPDVKEQVNDEDFYYTFILGNPATKSVLTSDEVGKFGKWEAGDQLGQAVNENTPGYANITLPTNDNPATFSIYHSGGLAVDDIVYTYYPYNSSATLVTAIPFEIPVSQNQTGNNFDFDAMPMVGEPFVVTEKSTTNQTPVGEIQLFNLGSVIDFQVYSANSTYAEETIISATLTANNAIAGSFTKDITGVQVNDASTLSISGYSATSVTTTVDNPATIGASRDAASHVYMVIAPTADVTGSVLVVTNKAKYTFNISSAQTFKRAGLKSFGLNLANCGNRVEEDTAVPVTGSYKLDDYYQESVKVNPLALDDVVTISTTTKGNSGKFFGNSPNRDWRLYQSEEAFVTVSVPVGYELQGIKFTYSNSNGGILEDAPSGEELIVSGNSKTYNVVNSGTATNGQVRLTAISVKYVSVPVPEGYVLISSLDDLETGLYVITGQKDGKYYAMQEIKTGKISGVEVAVSDGVIAPEDGDDYALTILKNNNDQVAIGDGTNYLVIKSSSTTDFGTSTTASYYSVSTDNSGAFVISNTRYLAWRGGDYLQFGNYASVTGDYSGVYLFKYNGTSTIKQAPTTTVIPDSPINLTVGATQQLNVSTDSDGTISYTTSNDAIATVSTEGLITAVAAGTTTITVTTAETSSFNAGVTLVTVNVSSPIINDGSQAHPYTVTEVISYMNVSGDNRGPVYITGKVSNVYAPYDQAHGTGIFYISDDGETTSAQFEAYGVKFLGNNAWVNGNTQIAVGDEVIVYGGELSIYNNSVYETTSNSGSYLYSLNGSIAAETVPTITKTDITGVAAAGVSPATTTVSFANNDGWTATVTPDGVVVTSASLSGTTITYSVAANTGDSRIGSITVTLSKSGRTDVTATISVAQLAGNGNTFTTESITSGTFTFADNKLTLTLSSGVTIEQSKVSGNTNVNSNYNTVSTLRLYKGHALTFSGKTFTRIEIVVNGTNYGNTLTASTGTLTPTTTSGGTIVWEGESDNVVITNTATGSNVQLRTTSFEVTYE